MTDLNVRSASELNDNELREVADIYQEAFSESGMDYNKLQEGAADSDEELYVLSVGSGNDERFVAAGRVGFKYGDLDAQLSDAAVKPELQGKGLGKALFSARDSRAHSRGNGRVYTWASTENPAAQAIASEHGYVPAGIEVETEAPGNNADSKNILMVDPETLQDRERVLYATESTMDAVNSLLDGTELVEGVDASLEQVEPGSDPVEGYMLSAKSDRQGSLSFGMNGVSGRPLELELEDEYREVNSGTLQSALQENPYNTEVKVALNINKPEVASLAEQLVDEGYKPTALQLDNPLTSNKPSKSEVHDQLILEKTDEVHQLETTEEIAEWLENAELPAEPK